MTKTSKDVEYRVAGRDHETDMLGLLEEAAPEIPIPLNTPGVQEKLKTDIIQCHRSGKSWVAVDASGKVVGVALARQDFDESGAISLRDIAVSANARGQGVCTSLIEKLKANGVPLTASVLHDNQSAMAGRLQNYGFSKVGSDDRETKFRWAPDAAPDAERKTEVE